MSRIQSALEFFDTEFLILKAFEYDLKMFVTNFRSPLSAVTSESFSSFCSPLAESFFIKTPTLENL